MLTKMSVFDKIERPYFAEPPRRMVNVYRGKEPGTVEEMLNEVVPEDGNIFVICFVRLALRFFVIWWLSMEDNKTRV